MRQQAWWRVCGSRWGLPAVVLLLLLAASCLQLLTPIAAQSVQPTAAQLLPGPVSLVADQYDDDPTANCSTSQVVSVTVDALAAVPQAQRTVVVYVNLADSQLLEATVLNTAGLQVDLFQTSGWLAVYSATGWLRYRVDSGMAGPTAIAIAISGQQFRLCVNLACPWPAQASGITVASTGWASTTISDAGDITLGSPAGKSIAGSVQGLWVLPGSVEPTAIASAGQALPEVLAAMTAPAAATTPTTDVQVLTAAAVVGSPVSVALRASTAAGSSLRARVTFFGAAPSNCNGHSCGSHKQTLYSSTTSLQETLAVTYDRAGRYTIRVQVADDAGGWASQDVVLLVRKLGDSGSQAACCRSTGLIIAQQLGRPIDPVNFRPAWLTSSAAAVGWDAAYLQGSEDLEAERLFDYTLLAPLETGPSQNLTCADRHLAGLASPRVAGVDVTPLSINAASNQGHNKRVAILPQGFSWASTTAWSASRLPVCVKSWTDWPSRSPYGVKSTSGSCSYTCTPDGVQELVTLTGTMDRWAEAVIENTYGRVSLLPQPVVLPTLFMPKEVAAGLNSFTYTESRVQQHLQGLGYDMYRDFHTIVVLSPLPQFVNPGNTAWANGGGSPMIYVMRCNPQHYYLLHEIGHRFGMPHATIYKLTNQTSTPEAPTTSLLSAGTMEDAYSDRLDIMACCKGDYSLYNRILAGWVPGAERVTLGLADMAATSAGPVIRRYTLWPYDRPESKGQLKGVTLRIEDGKVLVLGYRSLPFWQDVRIGQDSTGAKPHAPEHMRNSLHGLSVEYARRAAGSTGSSSWSARGLLDFNMAYARYPSALPPAAGTFPPDPPGAAFTLLREGDAWLDAEHNLLLAVERLVPCQGGTLPVHSYGVYNFYGFRGENPGQEAVRRADYTGYAGGLRCLQLRVVTGVTSSPGTLDVKLRLQGLDDHNRLLLGGQQCGFPVRPRLRLEVPAGVDVLSIVWRNNLNQTVALDSREVELPPLQPLDEASASNTEHCNTGCDWRYHVKVLAADGSQTEVDVAVGSVSLSTVSLTATYRYYLASSILTAVEYRAAPVLPLAAARAGAAEGRSLLQEAVSLQAAAAQAYPSSSLPDFSCSSQWSVSLNLQLPSAAVAPSAGASSAQVTPLLTVLSGASGGWPSVALKVSAAGTALAVQWGPSAVMEQPVSIKPNKDGWASVHLAVVRDGSRLGVWLDSSGSWLLEDVWCVPSSTALRYCTQPADSSGDSSFAALRLGSAGGPGSADILITSARVYNYALPRLSLAAESGCVEDGSCGRFLVSGWAPPLASSIPAGSVSGSAVAAVSSTPIKLRATSYYLLVGPWSACSARCGGGWSNRDVRCMKLGSAAAAPTVEVSLEDCPLGDEAPANSRRCNTVACPQATFQLLASQHSSCRTQGCQLLPSAADGAQLACINSVGQPLPAGQCCQMCNATDWAAIPWTSSLAALQQHTAVTAGSSVTRLDTTLSSAFSASPTLQDVMLSSSLASVCQAGSADCSQVVRWQLGAWGTCSVSCGGGLATRSASCVNAATGESVVASQCVASLGQVAPSLLSRPCNQQPCAQYAWQVGSWSACGGDSAYGHSSRPVTCVDAAGNIVNPGSSTCTSAQPASKAVCLAETTLTACRPSFLAGWYFRDQDCYGHGVCGAAGCDCKDGWHGQFCEVGPRCKGVMDWHDRCCASGVLNVTGECCPTGSVLDAGGACCQSGQVDMCGVCGGSSWTVDVRGVCCTSVLDAYGLCCSSGAVDECGVCDGDGTSCSLHLRLLLQVPQGTTLTGAGMPVLGGLTGSAAASPAVVSWAQAALQQAALSSLASTPQLQLQPSQVAAKWTTAASANGSTTVTPPNRHLLAGGAGDSQAAATELCDVIVERPDGSAQPADCSGAQSGVECPSPAPSAPASGTTLCSTGASAAAAAHQAGASRKLQQASGVAAASTEPLVQADLVLTPSNLAEISGAAAASTAGNSSRPAATLLSLGRALVSGLEQQAAGGGSSSGAGSQAVSGPQLLRVMLAQRVGVCGNGVCEVGERQLLNSEGELLQEADTPCPQDCPGVLQLCPAPVGLVGDPAVECGGNGRCMRSTGTCDCSAGYTGAACESCLASFYPTRSRACIPQYISGKNIFDPIEADRPLSAWALALVVIAAVAAATVLAGTAATLWNWLVHGVPPRKQLHSARQKGRAWCRLLLRRVWGPAGKQAGVSQKYLLREGLELAAAAELRTKGQFLSSDGSVHEKPALRQRRISTEGSNEQGDLLKAVRPGQSSPGTTSGRSSSGAMPPAISTPHLSNEGSTGGGRSGSRFGPAPPLASALSGVAASIQRGMSGAGQAVARTLSGAGLRAPISQHGLASYERLVDHEAGGGEPALPVSQHGAARSRLRPAAGQLQLQHSAPQPGRFFLPGVSNLPVAGQHSDGPGSPVASVAPAGVGQAPSTSGQRPRSPAAGWARPVPAAASLQDGLGAAGAAADGAMLLRPPGLARIRTRPKERSGTGGLPLQQGGQEGVSLAAGEPLAGASAGLGPGSYGTYSSGAVEGDGSSRRWRTRLEYSAELVAGGSPIAVRSQQQQSRDRRAPSEPGVAGSQRSRGQAGLQNFVPTPTATDATNRNVIEAFGQRMELWFSPRNPNSSTGSGRDSGSGSGSVSGSGGLAGAMAQFAALRASRLPVRSHQQEQQQEQQQHQQEQQKPKGS